MSRQSACSIRSFAEAAACVVLLACEPRVVIGSYVNPSSSDAGSTSAGAAAVGGNGAGGVLEAAGTSAGGAAAGAGGAAAGAGGAPASGGEGGEAAPTILWAAEHESGDLSEWEEEGGWYGSEAPSASTERAHSGAQSLVFTIDTSDGDDVERVYQPIVAQPAYYSAWFLVEQEHVAAEWWNIVVFRGHYEQDNPYTPANLWDVSFGSTEDGQYYLIFYDHLSGQVVQAPDVPVPVGEWVHIETYLDYRPPSDTVLRYWVNGELAIEVTGLAESPTEFIYWAVGSGSNGLTPPVATLYVDDAAIATGRLGAALP